MVVYGYKCVCVCVRVTRRLHVDTSSSVEVWALSTTVLPTTLFKPFKSIPTYSILPREPTKQHHNATLTHQTHTEQSQVSPCSSWSCPFSFPPNKRYAPPSLLLPSPLSFLFLLLLLHATIQACPHGILGHLGRCLLFGLLLDLQSACPQAGKLLDVAY